MNVLLFRPAEFDRHYNCAWYNPNMVPAGERDHTVLGVTLFAAYVFLLVLYMVCFVSMLRCDQRGRPSYRLMMLLALMHMTGMQTGGLFTAVFAIKGTMFCDYPRLSYVMGGLGLATWCGSTLCGVILALNRCCEMYRPGLAGALFSGWRQYVWYAIPLSYFGFFLFCTTPPVYNGIYMSWFFNPWAGVKGVPEDPYFFNAYHAANNLADLSLGSLVSLCFVLLYMKKTGALREKMSQSDKMLCLQVFLIELSQLTASGLYVLEQVLEVDFYVTLLASVAYFSSQAGPPVIYLCFNKTIKNVLYGRILQIRTYHSSTHSNQGINNTGNTDARNRNSINNIYTVNNGVQ